VKWHRAITGAAEDPAADLETAVRGELADLWHDLDFAISLAIRGGWSMQCDNITTRIVQLSRLAGATPWGQIPMTLLLDGTYTGILNAAGIPFDPPDMDKVRELEASRPR
jgi:hypothetical protein